MESTDVTVSIVPDTRPLIDALEELEVASDHDLLWDADSAARGRTTKARADYVIERGRVVHRRHRDAPIYDRLRHRPYRLRAGATTRYSEIKTPVTPEVQAAIEDIASRQHEELIAALAPHGLHPYDLAPPTYERIVYPEELR